LLAFTFCGSGQKPKVTAQENGRSKLHAPTQAEIQSPLPFLANAFLNLFAMRQKGYSVVVNCQGLLLRRLSKLFQLHHKIAPILLHR
jgi:hypothetical protein